MDLFEYIDYKKFVHDRIDLMPRKGRGEFKRIAAALRMHSTRVSQIFNSGIDLTLEQAADFCHFWGLSQLESEYFLLLVQKARAGSAHLSKILEAQADGLRAKARHLEARIKTEVMLSESDRSKFYSSWIYSGVRLATSIPHMNSVDALAEYFDLPRAFVIQIIDFLLEAELCERSGHSIQMKAKSTHLETNSPLVHRHHVNWRIKALSGLENRRDDEISFTCPASIAKSDQTEIRDLLMKSMDRFLRSARASDPPDTLICLNLDLFNF